MRPPLPPDLESEEDAIAKAIALSLEKPISKDIIDISKSENSPVTVKPTASTPSQKPFTGFTTEVS